MAMEIEAKFRVASHDGVRERLRGMNAECCGVVIETNVILDRPDGSLRHAGCGLRVRSTRAADGSVGVATLTFKGPRKPGPLKSREELEVTVGEGAMAERIMASCGFVTMLWYEKRRESWIVGDCHVELDEPPHLGLFVEIEGPGEAAIAKVQTALGLGGEAHVRESYVRMLIEYCRDHGIVERRLELSGHEARPT